MHNTTATLQSDGCSYSPIDEKTKLQTKDKSEDIKIHYHFIDKIKEISLKINKQWAAISLKKTASFFNKS